MTNQRIITTSDVAINTVTIEVKVMKIGNRQVTLSVFRQLPDEQLIDAHTGKIRGNAWGKVNYHPDKCEDSPEHLHIVWQKDHELRRATVYKDWSKQCALVDIVISYAKAYVYACLLEGDLGPLCEWDHRRECVAMSVDAEAYGIGQYHFNVPSTRGYRVISRPTHAASGDTREAILEYLNANDLPHDSSVLLQGYFMPEARRLPSLAKIWQAAYAQLEALDQLFIAV